DLRPKILGKRTGHLPTEFEYRPEIIQRAVHEVFQLGTAPEPATEFKPPPGRPPVLCAACPHRSAFYAVRAAFSEDTLFFNDIGCYTLGYGPPLETADALLCMGAGFTLAAGVSRTTGERTVGFMGDSTFFHSGMPALLDAIKANTNMVAVIMDNEVTAMTGFQESPSAAVEQGRIQQRVDIAGVVRALGAEHVETVDPEDLATTIEAFRRARDRDDLSVIITRRPCPVFARREGVAAGAEVPQIRTYRIDHDRCRHCGRESCGQRCSQGVVMGFERAMARARSLEPAGPGVEKAPPAVAPCASKCPLYLCIQGYAAHIAAGQYADALELIVSGLPLPESVCRVCHKPCETACVRGGLDQPVAINDLKRFVMDWAREQGDHPYRPKAEADNGMHVAVVGAGPSGLSAAHELRLRGYAVTLLDANSEAGGLLLTGIPRYRLPLAALRRDVQRILDTGVEFVGNRRLGDNLRLDRLLAEHDAVYLAVGAGNSLELGLEGNGNGPPVIDAVGYLRGDGDAAAGNGKRVVVVGGGNAAIDAARSLLRDGARQVVIACLEGRHEMPAIQSEIREAEREGIQIHAGVKAMRLLPAGVEVLQVTARGAAPRSPDDYAPVADTEMLLAADLLVTAIGQVPDRTTLGDDVPELSWQDGRLVVDPQNGQTSHPRVFAGGDLAFGVQTVTDAIAHGLRAAWGMDRELRSAEHADRRMPPPLVTAAPAVT
ncbi:MAG: FAD-dependent oxidoreductase, partial [Planctomycetota bacterium]